MVSSSSFSGFRMPRQYALALMVASYAAGLAGLLLPQTQQLFQLMTPFHLLLTAILLFGFHPDWNKPFVLFCLLAFAVGYGIEVAGVHTGAIFGQYWYGDAFGPKLFEVPLLIGLNWLVLVYVTGVICEPLPWPIVLKATVAALLMVGLDVLIEPISGAYDFWYWEGNNIPLQNFFAWFITAFGLLLLFYRLPFVRRNSLALPLFILQLIFFVSLLLFT